MEKFVERFIRVVDILGIKANSKNDLYNHLYTSSAALSNIKGGRQLPTIKNVLALTGYDINMNWLFYGSGDMTIDSSSHSLLASDISTDYAPAKDNCIEKLVANENRIIDILEKLSKAQKGI